jgi:hypothetical protein
MTEHLGIRKIPMMATTAGSAGTGTQKKQFCWKIKARQ